MTFVIQFVRHRRKPAAQEYYLKVYLYHRATFGRNSAIISGPNLETGAAIPDYRLSCMLYGIVRHPAMPHIRCSRCVQWDFRL